MAGGGDADSTAAGVTASFEVAENAPDAIAGTAGPILGLIKFSDPDTGDTHEVTVDDDRFQVIRHPAEGEEGSSWWLTLKSGATLDFEAAASIDLTLTVTDSSGGSATADVTITVTDVNEAPGAPTLDAADGALAVAENDGSGGNIGTLSSSDPEGGEVTFSVDDEEHFEIETVGGTTLLKYKDGAGIDFEGGKVADDGTLTIMLTATDAQGIVSEPTPVKVAVTNVNEAPAIKVDGGGDADSTVGDVTASFTVAENAPDFIEDVAGPVLGLITLSDPDGDELTADSVTVSDGDRFQVIAHPAAGEEGSRLWLTLRPGVTLDRETEASIELTLTVTDSGDPAMSATSDPVTITVTDVNEAPTIGVADGTTPGGAPARPSIPENQAGVPVGEVTVSDEDEADAHLSDRITVSDNRFEVEEDDEGGLWLKLKDGVSLDFEAAPSVDVTVTVTDSAGASASETVTVNVLDVSEAPAIMFSGGDGTEETEAPDGAAVNATVEEHTGGEEFEPALVGKVEVSDPDGEALAIGDIEVDDGRFDLVAIGDDELGGIWLRLNEPLDADGEGGGEVTVKLTVTDGDGLTGEVDAVVTVEGVNDSPTIELRTTEDATGEISENATGAVYEIVADDAEDEIGADHITIDDPRFEVRADDEGGLWAYLKDEVDYEAVKSIDIKATVTDSGGATATDSATVTILNDNDAPTASDSFEADVVTGEAGKALGDDKGVSVSLTGAFSDADGDRLDYAFSGNPSWLTVSRQDGTAEDGSRTVEALFTGTPLAGTKGSYEVTITATDGEIISDPITVKVLIDDGNDAITAVNLLDSQGKVVFSVDVDENDRSGVDLGEIRVTDPDDPGHPNGMHKIEILKGGETVSDPKADLDDGFEVREVDGIQRLFLKEGSSLDHEKGGGSVDVIIRAVDMNGDTNDKGNAFITGHSIGHRTIPVFADDKNDAPKANAIGNWWVIAKDDLNADDNIGEGSWLSFRLDTTGDDAAFEDDDGDKLTYSLSGPSILEIDENGMIQNAKDALPIEGNHKFTVTATDPDGLQVSSDFYVAIALSGDGTLATANDDNDEPAFSNLRELDYAENSGDGTVVATFTVTDDDNGLGHHPFALDSVRITGLEVEYQDATPNLPIDASDPSSLTGPSADFYAAFRLSEPRKSGNAWTYDLIARDTDPGRDDTTDILDRETVDRVTVTVTADNGIVTGTNPSASDSLDIHVDILDVNEAPEVVGATPMLPQGALLNAQLQNLQQSMEDKVTLYINLQALWNDPDERDDRDDLIFTAESSTPWIKILNDPFEWDDRPDNVDWPTSPAADMSERIVVAAAPTTALGDGPPSSSNRDPWVVIVEIDRTGSNDGQGDKGSFTLTAKDDRGGPMSTLVVPVEPTDQNLPVPDNVDGAVSANVDDAVRISGSPIEGATLRATFNDDRDPDLRGDADPALVLYRWFRAPDTDGDGVIETGDDDAADVLVRVSTDNTYTLTQSDVGMGIRVEVQHYEVFNGRLVSINTDDGTGSGTPIPIQSSTPDSSPVRNTPDAPAGSITILTATGNALVVEETSLSIRDEDLITTANPTGAVADDAADLITWQVSDNGRDWSEADGALAGSGGVANGILTLADGGDGEGKLYRAVATYDTDPGAAVEMQSFYSEPVRVANIRDGTSRDAFPTPTITGSPSPEGTLTVNANEPGTTVDVQWQVAAGDVSGGATGSGNWSDIPGATGASLDLTEANSGQMIRAVVSYQSKAPNSQGVTAVVAVVVDGDGDGSPGGAIRGAVQGTVSSPVLEKNHTIEATVTGTGHGPDLSDGVAGVHAGHNLSLTETIDLRSLFQDPDSPRLTFTVVTPAAYLGANANAGNVARDSLYVFDEATGGVLTLNTATGELTFNSHVYHGHDGAGGTANDGAGNVISLTINANDDPDGPGPLVGNDSATDAMVNIRINVAPTGITFTDNDADDGGSAAAFAVKEHVGSEQAGDRGHLIATLDVLDENLRTHNFGTHEVTVSDNDRFMVVRNNYDNARGQDDGDGSTWELRLKPGVKLDYETEFADDMDATIELTLTATDGGGLSTPTMDAATGRPMPITLTVTVVDVETGDLNEPPARMPNNVPGLDDDETGTTVGTGTTEDAMSEKRDDDNDGDIDGGADPSPDPSTDAMMMSSLDDGLF